ncbi:MAG: hypothetical protein QOC62_1056 [Mycobacterium sp.]|nr:hypothetical protein [Mycobacterium sp.]
MPSPTATSTLLRALPRSWRHWFPGPVATRRAARLSVDPTAAIHTPNDALDAAEELLQALTVHHTGRFADRQDRAEVLWSTAAAVPLAAMLYAASPAGNHAGIRWVRRAVDDVGNEGDTSPCWCEAAAVCREALGDQDVNVWLATHLMNASSWDHRQRSSIVTRMRCALETEVHASKALAP